MAAMKRLALSLLAISALAVPAAAPAVSPPGASANGSLVPRARSGGVKVGMTVAQFRERLGTPASDRPTVHPILGLTRTLRYGQLTVSFDGRASTSPATAVMTESRTDRTAAGLGVGSTDPGRHQGPAVRDKPRIPDLHPGRAAPRAPGHRLLADQRGRVKRVTLGRVID
jgi:hypothetical protein